MPAAARAQEQAVVVLDLDGVIGPATSDYVARSFIKAQDQGAGLIVLWMDTPGGLVDSTRSIVREILASPVPVVTFVAPSGARAASAGTYILYASHVAAMAPGTNLGAATPVQIGGGLPGTPAPDDEEAEGDGKEPHQRRRWRTRSSTTWSPTSARSRSCAGATSNGRRRRCARRRACPQTKRSSWGDRGHRA